MSQSGIDPILSDTHGRGHDYLRISMVDSCNLRCTYCMPENVRFLPPSKLMSADEMLGIAKVFVDAGVRKIRLTGGEPLLRRDAAEIIRGLGALGVELAITTNGIFLNEFLGTFREVGMRSLNVSLDTLKRDRFAEITRRDQFETVMTNIHRAVDEGFRVKVNMVVMRGVNDDELLDFVEWGKDANIHIRFIEFMPFDGNSWDWGKVFSYAQMLEVIGARYPIQKLHDGPNSTSKAHQVPGFKGTFAVISTVTQPFCEGCNRIRLTAEGKIRNCLFAKGEIDLLSAYRKGEDIRPLIGAAMQQKAARLGGLPEFQEQEQLLAGLSKRPMVKIGG